MSTQPQFGIASVGRQLTTFDRLLAAIPLVLLAGVVSAHLLPVPPFVGIAIGAALAASLVGYGIYVLTRLQATPGESDPPLGCGVGCTD
ncbi:hypothetical protein [Halohasta salina]|uniref:hypothetical protein n=1 Tax=Halohasta salina TaxID=2961621 RepID=UPI0020A4D0AA|nr:hypothetical protein [Halohasta salina]